MSLYIGAYDVAGDKRRRKVDRILNLFGHRIQESVFELRLDAAELDDLRRQLAVVLRQEDLFDLYPVDSRPDRARYRWQRQVDRPTVVQFV